jgi:hypothetical protein
MSQQGTAFHIVIVIILVIIAVFVYVKLRKSPSNGPTFINGACNSNGGYQVPEVYYINNGQNLMSYDDALNLCSSFGGRLATLQQLDDAAAAGAQWWDAGIVNDSNWNQDNYSNPDQVQTVYFPMQQINPGYTVQGVNSYPASLGGNNSNPPNGAVCYGIKPPPGTPGVTIKPFFSFSNEGIDENCIAGCVQQYGSNPAMETICESKCGQFGTKYDQWNQN